MQSLNSLLANTTSYFSDASIHEKLKASLDPKLTCHCNANKVDKILILGPWALKAKHQDENHHADLKCMCEVTKEVFNRCKDNNKCHHGTNGPANIATYTVNAAAATSTAILGMIQCLAASVVESCDLLVDPRHHMVLLMTHDEVMGTTQ